MYSWELVEEKSGRLKWNRREQVKKEYGILGSNGEEEVDRRKSEAKKGIRGV